MGRLAWHLPQPPLDATRLRAGWLRSAALVGAAAGAELALAFAVTEPRLRPALMLALGLVALVLVFRFPFAAACGVLVLVAAVVDPGTYKFSAGPIDLRLEELLLGALLLVAIVRPQRAWWGGAGGGALAAFLGIVALSALLAIQAGRAGLGDAVGSARLVAPLALYYVVIRLFPHPDQVRRLLTAGVVLAAAVGIVSILVASPGSPLIDVLSRTGNENIRDDEGLGLVNRVRLPGLALAYGLFWYAAVRSAAAHGARRTLWFAFAAAMGASLVLSFNRNMWIGLALGLALMLVLSRPQVRQQFAIVILILVAGALGVTLSSARVSDDSPLHPIIERGSTLIDPTRTSRESSLNARRMENRFAIAAIEDRPILGVGPGAPFGFVTTEKKDPDSVVATRVEVLGVHNQYLHVLLMGGALALLALLAFLGTQLMLAFTRGTETHEVLALGVAVVMIMVSAIVMISFVNPTSALVLGLISGAITVLGGRRVPQFAPEPRAHAMMGGGAS
jgi:hypothetical protein